jgi:hypothetical protein
MTGAERKSGLKSDRKRALKPIKQPIPQIASRSSQIGDFLPYSLQVAQQLAKYSRSHELILSLFLKMRITDVSFS